MVEHVATDQGPGFKSLLEPGFILFLKNTAKNQMLLRRKIKWFQILFTFTVIIKLLQKMHIFVIALKVKTFDLNVSRLNLKL